MSRARHMKKDGGTVPDAGEDPGKDIYAGEHSNVEKEAEGKRRKKGGAVDGKKPKHHMHRGRARGGRTGSDLRPLTSANKGKDATEHKTGDVGDADQERD